ncbi:AMP-binding protein [Gordonia sp. NPDC003376]
MMQDRPWLASYGPGVPDDVTVPDNRITDLLIEAAERDGDVVAVDFFGATTSYTELATLAGRGAHALRQLGVQAGDAVSLVLPNSTSHVGAFHAVLACGATVVEHNPTYTVAELHDQLVTTGSVLVLCWRNRVLDVHEAAIGTAVREVISVDVADDLPWTARLALRLPVAAARTKRRALTGADTGDAQDWRRLVATAAPQPLQAVGQASDIALIMFTGGTTGTPKAATLTHRNLVANATQGRAWAGFDTGSDVVYGMLPFFHAFGMMFCLVLPPLIGATLVAFPNFDPTAVVAAQRRRPASFIPGVAPMFDRLLDAAGDTDLTSIRVAFSGAMPLSPAVAERWESTTGGLLIEGYGMTECSPIALGNPCSERRRRGALGIPFPNTEIRVVDAEDHTVEVTPDADGVRHGELCVRGPQVFAGYLGQPEATAQTVDAEGWLYTGDVVDVDHDGFAVLVDRVKELILVGGFNVFPSVVESHLWQMPGVANIAVVGIPRGDGTDEEVLAAIVVDPNRPAPTLAEVRQFGSQRLPGYAIPRHLEVVDDLPVNMIGKTLRRSVRAAYLERHRA